MTAVVVGAGIVGASVTYHLARRGVPVTLLDQGPEPGTGATGSSFAWIGDSGRGEPGGAQDVSGSVLADHRRLEAEVPHLTVRWTGSVTWTPTTAHPAQEPLGPGQFRIGRSEIAALEPSLRNPPERAVHTPTDGGVDPSALTNALVAAARTRGATVLHDTTVTSLQRTGEGVVEVVSSAGLHHAAPVVLATGTNTPTLSRQLGVELPLAASPACVVRLAAPPGLVKTTVATPDFEVREVSDGNLLVTLPPVEGTSAGVLEQSAEDALRHVQTAFNGSEPCRLLDQHIGSRPIPANGPLVGYLTPERSVYVTVLHAAVSLAPTIGRLVANELTTGTPAPELRRCRPAGINR